MVNVVAIGMGSRGDSVCIVIGTPSTKLDEVTDLSVNQSFAKFCSLCICICAYQGGPCAT